MSSRRPYDGWAEAMFGCASAEEWVRGMAWETLAGARQEKPPIGVEALFPARRILGCRYRAGPCEARLMVEHAGFVIETNELRSTPRARFSRAHEVAHTFFYDISSSPPRRLLPSHRSKEEERLCNVGAAELLMPADLFAQTLRQLDMAAGQGFRLGAVGQLSAAFKVSFPAVARRLVEDLGLWDAVLLGCTRTRPRPAEQRRKERRPWPDEPAGDWRLAWCAKPAWAARSLFIPSGSSEGASRPPRIRIKALEQIGRGELRPRGPVTRFEPPSALRLGNLARTLRSVFGAQQGYPVHILPLPLNPGARQTQPASQACGAPKASEAAQPSLDALVCIPIPRRLRGSHPAPRGSHTPACGSGDGRP